MNAVNGQEEESGVETEDTDDSGVSEREEEDEDDDEDDGPPSGRLTAYTFSLACPRSNLNVYI